MTARRLAAALACLLAAVALTACSTGRDAVASGGEFQFVAPGGQTEIRYDPPANRGTVTGLAGDSLTEPGRRIGLHDFPGQVVVVNIWGSWCGPCRAEMDDLQQLHQGTAAPGASGVTVLGVDVRDERTAAADFVRDRKITYPSIFDQPGRSLDALHGYPRNTVPSTIVLDRRHRVAAVFLTAVRIGQLAPVVQQVAAEAG
ncbi:TlpA family protein disulfide reductase [Pseudonocardia acaciae]|uniref:TlpA family protein disulfide reductase n=1 Tax=Pseudonocardia acaciae TaxID=551276 RepID=UPI00048FA26A|nr:TlpA disulfide reductase family protein [Pseudonocardia acaciae]